MRWTPLALFVAARLAIASSASAEPSIDECLSSSEDGQRERDEGRYLRARASFATCASNACPAVVQRDCASWLLEVDDGMPSLVFVARDGRGVDLADVVVRMDGAVLTTRLDGKPVAVDPGDHAFTFAAGGRAVEQRAIVHVGEKNRVLRVTIGAPSSDDAADEPRAAPSGHRVPFGSVVLGGVALASLGSAAVLWWTARSDLDSLESRPCAQTKTCDADDVRSVRTRLILGDVLAGVGVAAAGAATLLWLTRDRSVAVSVAPTASSRGPMLRIRAAF